MRINHFTGILFPSPHKASTKALPPHRERGHHYFLPQVCYEHIPDGRRRDSSQHHRVPREVPMDSLGHVYLQRTGRYHHRCFNAVLPHAAAETSQAV